MPFLRHVGRVRVLLSLATALVASGCVQLVAFEQPLIGHADTVDSVRPSGATLCDPDIAMGASALCTESCRVDPASHETTCGDRVTVDGSRASVDVSGLHEVEVTVRACAAPNETRPLRIEGQNGASIALAGRVLEVRAADVARARPYRDEEFFPASGCAEQSFVFQTGRMELLSGGRRLCSEHLVPVDGRWALELGEGLRSLELCFRARRETAQP